MYLILFRQFLERELFLDRFHGDHCLELFVELLSHGGLPFLYTSPPFSSLGTGSVREAQHK